MNEPVPLCNTSSWATFGGGYYVHLPHWLKNIKKPQEALIKATSARQINRCQSKQEAKIKPLCCWRTRKMTFRTNTVFHTVVVSSRGGFIRMRVSSVVQMWCTLFIWLTGSTCVHNMQKKIIHSKQGEENHSMQWLLTSCVENELTV